MKVNQQLEMKASDVVEGLKQELLAQEEFVATMRQLAQQMHDLVAAHCRRIGGDVLRHALELAGLMVERDARLVDDAVGVAARGDRAGDRADPRSGLPELVRDERSVRSPPDHVGEGAAAVDPEVPNLRHRLCHRSFNPSIRAGRAAHPPH